MVKPLLAGVKMGFVDLMPTGTFMNDNGFEILKESYSIHCRYFVCTEDKGKPYGLPVVRESATSSNSTVPLSATLS